MTPEDRLLFACTRQKVQESHRRLVQELCMHPVQWQVVYATADAHAVAPLVYANLKQCGVTNLGIPEDVQEKFEHEFYRNIIAKRKITAKTAQVLAFLNQHNVETMLIKGAALDLLVYEQPWFTTANDVDLILKQSRHETTIGPFLKSLDRLQEIQFEYDFNEHHDISMNGVLPVDFATVWADARKISYHGSAVWVMSPEDMLIASCINSCRHRFFRLKALCDIAEIIRTYRNLNWAECARKAKEYHCNVITYAALYATQTTVGCEFDGGVYQELAVHPLRSRLVRTLVDRMSFVSLESLFTGTSLLGRNINQSLLLPYTTYGPLQVWKKVVFASLHPQIAR